MFTLRVVRHDQHDQLLAECPSTVVPTRGESIQLDTFDAQGEQSRPSTVWHVMSVTLHVPSIASQQPANGAGGPRGVTLVEVRVMPDVALPHGVAHAAKALSESQV
jgi:hypothetical protein